MSIWSSNGFHTPQCDGCDEELQGEFEFYDAVQAMRNEGWLYESGKNYCLECQRNEN